MNRRRVLLAGMASVVVPFRYAHAQAFPARPITLYCAFPAGGPTDQLFRALAESVSKELGQPVLVDNKPGVGGTLAPGLLKSAKPDGYTLSQMPLGVFRIPHMQKVATIDPLQDFSYVICLTGYTFGLVVPAGSPYRTLQDFVEYAKKNPAKVDYGSTGTGTSPHLVIEEFATKAGIQLTHVPFKGSADLMTAILGGHIMAASDSTGWAPHVNSGKLRLLAVYGSKRARNWPDVPTLAELGYSTVSDSPFGIAGPAGMPVAVVRTLHDAFKKALDEPKVVTLLERLDQPVIYLGPEDYAKFAKQTFEEERRTIDRLGLKGTM